MKQNDIAVIIIVVFIGGVGSFFLAGFLFGGESSKYTTKVVDPIQTEFRTPDTRYFNSSAIDPTRPVEIGGGSVPAAEL